MMKHRLIKRIMAVLTASTLILPAIPAQTAVAEEAPDIPVERGIFGAEMKIALLNDGPFTLILDSEDLARPKSQA